MTVELKGQTFQHRDTLRNLGGHWSPSTRSWFFDYATTSTIEKLSKMVGCQLFNNTETDDVVKHDVNADIKRSTNTNETAVYGDDETYLNYFKDENPLAFFGFSNLSEFVKYIENVPTSVSQQTRHERNTGWETHMPKWFGTKNMKEALSLAKNGWSDGIELYENVLEELTVEHALNKKRSHSLTGGQVSVGRMLSGNPKHMNKRTKQPSKKTVTLFVETYMTSGVTALNAAIRAATIAAIADLTEANGYSCELVAVLTTSVTGGQTKPGAQAAVTLKSAGERLNISDVIFALGHPSFFRRMLFGAVGSSEECRPLWWSQGSPSAAFNSHHPTGKNEFYIRQLNSDNQERIDHGETLKEKALTMLPMIEPVNLPIKIRND